MNEAYNSQVKKLKFHLNEKTETISLSKLNLQPPVELTQKLQKAREEGEKIRSENPKIIAYGGQEAAARELQQGLDWNKISDAQTASIRRGMKTGTISQQRGEERIKNVKGEAESQRWSMGWYSSRKLCFSKILLSKSINKGSIIFW